MVVPVPPTVIHQTYQVGTELEVYYQDELVRSRESGWFTARVTHHKAAGVRVLYVQVSLLRLLWNTKWYANACLYG